MPSVILPTGDRKYQRPLALLVSSTGHAEIWDDGAVRHINGGGKHACCLAKKARSLYQAQVALWQRCLFESLSVIFAS